MELEAITQALGWVQAQTPENKVIIIATDSRAVLSKIEAGYAPRGWIEAEDALAGKQVIWCYVPGHAGVLLNEHADKLAAQAEPQGHLECYSQDIVCLSRYRHRKTSTDSITDSSEGLRLIEANVPYGASRSSALTGRERCIANQHQKGNTTKANLQILMERDVSQGSCGNATPQLYTAHEV